MAERGDRSVDSLETAQDLAHLFARHADQVYRFALRRTGSWSDAEDLTSMTFLEAWRRRDRVVLVEGSLVPWLLGVATNLARNRARSQRRYRAALARLPDPHALPDVADDVADRLDAAAAADAVVIGIRCLPDRDRDVAILCLWHGLTPTEAAAALSVPAGTVRSRLHRVRRRLKEQDNTKLQPVRGYR